MISRSRVTQPGLTLAIVMNASAPGHAHADMTVAVGDAFMIEDVAGGHQLIRQFFQFRRVDFRHIFSAWQA